jgi:ribosomal protein L29
MAILRYNEIKKMDKKTRDGRLKELKMELVKSTIKTQKKNTKTKEIKRAIARLHTFNRSEKGQELKKQ